MHDNADHASRMKHSCNLQTPAFRNAKAIAKLMRVALAWPLLTRWAEEWEMDAVYLAVTFGFFALSWGLIILCEKL